MSIESMPSNPFLKGVPLIWDSLTIKEKGRTIGAKEVSLMSADYVVHAQAMACVMGIIDEEDHWNGPKYVAAHVYSIDHLVGSHLTDEIIRWDGKKTFDLMLLSLPKENDVESAEQKQAREIVKACLQKSFGSKSTHGLIFGETLGSLWRKHVGSDGVPGTHAHWLKHGTMYGNPDEISPLLYFKVAEPFKAGMLREG